MGRTPTGEPPKFGAIKSVSSRHRSIMYRLAAGMRPVDISHEIGMSQSRLSVIMNSPLFKTEYGKVKSTLYNAVVDKQSDISATIKRLQPAAIQVLENLLMGKNTGQALKRNVANDILELGDIKKGAAQDGMSEAANFIASCFEIAEQRRRMRGDTVDDNTDLGTNSGNGHGTSNHTNDDPVVDVLAEVIKSEPVKQLSEGETLSELDSTVLDLDNAAREVTVSEIREQLANGNAEEVGVNGNGVGTGAKISADAAKVIQDFLTDESTQSQLQSDDKKQKTNG